MRGTATRDRGSMHMHGPAMRGSGETDTEDEREIRAMDKDDRRGSVLMELKRQSGVFFDDFEGDGEDTGGSDDEIAVELGDGEENGHGHGKQE